MGSCPSVPLRDFLPCGKRENSESNKKGLAAFFLLRYCLLLIRVYLDIPVLAAHIHGFKRVFRVYAGVPSIALRRFVQQMRGEQPL